MFLNVEKLQNNVFDGLLKNLLEKTNDLKIFLENEKHQYEAEMQKVNISNISHLNLIIYLSKTKNYVIVIGKLHVYIVR